MDFANCETCPNLHKEFESLTLKLVLENSLQKVALVDPKMISSTYI